MKFKTHLLVMSAITLVAFGCSKEENVKKDDAVLSAAPKDKVVKTEETVPEVKAAVKETVAAESEKVADKAAETTEQAPAEKPEVKEEVFAKDKMAPKSQGMTLKQFFKERKLPEVVAVVGDQKITREELEKDIAAQLPAPMREQPLPPQITAALAQNMKAVIDSIVNRRLLLKLAADDGIKPSPRLLLDKFDEFLKKMTPEQKAAFDKQLAAQGTSIAKQKEEAMKDTGAQEAIAIDNWVETKLMPSINVDEETAKKFYHENQDRFKKPGVVKVAHILVTPEKLTMEKMAGMSDEEKKKFAEEADKNAKAKAEEILAKVKKGEDFAKLAKENSACPSGKADGGNLPEFDKNGMTPGAGMRGGRMDKTFTEASFKLKPGEVTQAPVKTGFGYHIIKSSKKTEESFIPFKDVKDYLISSLKKEEVSKKVKSMIDAEKEKSKVKIFL